MKSFAPHPLEDGQEALSPLQTPEVEKTPAFKAIKERSIQSISNLLNENAMISPQSFCTLDQAVVRLRMPKGITAWKRQYPIAYNHAQFVDKEIKK